MTLRPAEASLQPGVPNKDPCPLSGPRGMKQKARRQECGYQSRGTQQAGRCELGELGQDLKPRLSWEPQGTQPCV